MVIVPPPADDAQPSIKPTLCQTSTANESKPCEPIRFHAATIAPSFPHDVEQRLTWATWNGREATKSIVSKETAIAMLEALEMVLKHEPTLAEVSPDPGSKVTVVGDTHGHYHDVCNMLKLVNYPSQHNTMVFNGDYVDRGAWGFELLLLLTAWKLTYPRHVVLLRGNHESTTCTTFYGFKNEVLAKYGTKDGKAVYQACKRVFSHLPLAALVAGRTLVLHGGLFRKPRKGVKKRKRWGVEPAVAVDQLGSLQDLRASSKGGMDPNGMGSTVLATDVLWSDPVRAAGLRTNDVRGVGLVFGPDITEAFLKANGLSLILRSHEGPDARAAAMEEAMSLELVEDDAEGQHDVEEQHGANCGAQGAHGDEVDAGAPVPEACPSGLPASEGDASPARAGEQGQAAAALHAARELLGQLREAAVAQCMALMQDGFTEDHVTPSGKLYTVFSAAAYPQFVADGEARVDNRGAVAVLCGPTYDTPEFVTYDAVRPLPTAAPYYDVGEVPGSDEEFEAVGEGSSLGGSSLAGESEQPGEVDKAGEVEQLPLEAAVCVVEAA